MTTAHHESSTFRRAEGYDTIGRYIGEIYDQVETQRDDIEPILSLVPNDSRILEPFCGHGRLLIPLARAGHELLGLDLSEQFLRILAERIQALREAVRARTAFRRTDVLADPWPTGFDAVILGGNCFYELATPQEQEHCIAAAAAAALRSGGYLYLDNNHMEGDLDPRWCRMGEVLPGFPTGVCGDGARIEGTIETIWFDAPQRRARFHRTVTVRTPDGRSHTREWMQDKHAPSTGEMRSWLLEHGFCIENLWGDRKRSAYAPTSDRAVFWAKKQ